jgi:hypothetical protein
LSISENRLVDFNYRDLLPGEPFPDKQIARNGACRATLSSPGSFA